ncbi:MAG: hydrogenase, partial [Gemmatimonadetes bacterium]|nr:hydrogenase [Gemmatimonadota bacterium]
MTFLAIGTSGLLALLFGAGVLLILAAGVAAVVLSRKPQAADFAFRALFVGGCVAGLTAAVGTLGGEATPAVRVAATVPGGPWVFGLDALSAIFLLAIFGVGAASAWYGVSYLARDPIPTQTSVGVGTPGRDRSRGGVALAHLFLAILVAAMALVVVAQAVVPFLIAWEVMALAAYVLIVFEQQRVEVRRAGLLYLVTTHAGTLALFALFALWGDGARDLTFAALGERGPLLAAGGASGGWVIALALLAFGLKAGMVPLHFWLPAAHSAAPSHVSALLSGVLIKMGIYGIMRVLLLMGTAPVWSGWFLLSVGAASGVLGVIWALAQHDIKRLLAYHSVENIGII